MVAGCSALMSGLIKTTDIQKVTTKENPGIVVKGGENIRQILMKPCCWNRKMERCACWHVAGSQPVCWQNRPQQMVEKPGIQRLPQSPIPAVVFSLNGYVQDGFCWSTIGITRKESVSALRCLKTMVKLGNTACFWIIGGAVIRMQFREKMMKSTSFMIIYAVLPKRFSFAGLPKKILSKDEEIII